MSRNFHINELTVLCKGEVRTKKKLVGKLEGKKGTLETET